MSVSSAVAMTDSKSNKKPFSRRRARAALVASCAALLTGSLGLAVWFESLWIVVYALLIATIIGALLAAISVWRSGPHPQVSGGVLAVWALGAIAVVVLYLIYPGTEPRTVDEAVALIDARMDKEGRRELARMGKNDLVSLHFGWGMSIRNEFGMWAGNERLLSDCNTRYLNTQYLDPDGCSGVIIERLWQKARSELPQTERLPLEALEAKMDRVTLAPYEYKSRSLPEVAALLNDAVRAQLPEKGRFNIGYDPADADYSVSWGEPRPSPFGDALRRLASNSGVSVRKTPPDLFLESYWKPVMPGVRGEVELKPLFMTEQGLRTERSELVSDEADWSRIWSNLSNQSTPRPQVDFRTNSLFVVALGSRSSTGYEIRAEAQGVHDRLVLLSRAEIKPGQSCATDKRGTYPTSVFLVPIAAEDAEIGFSYDTRQCDK